MSVKPMLATLGTVADIVRPGDDASVENEWAFEMKWDGIRAIAAVRNGRFMLHTRNGNDVTVSYPELGSLVDQVNGDAVLDGEIVALSKAGRPDFGRLQQRMGLTRAAEVEKAAREVPVHYMVFDILEVGGKSVAALEYTERRALLESTVEERDRVQVPPAFHGDLDAAVASSLKLGLEGVVAKRRDSAYGFGKRSRSWIKIKHHKTQEVIVGGWRAGNGRRASTVGSLLLGIPGDGAENDYGLRYVGRVGTGFGDRALEELTERLAKLARSTTPFTDMPSADARDAHWVTPSLVGEVEFAEWTATGKLRQPTWRGWRADKAPDDVVRES